ncbi:MAG: hypothetical protein JST30_12990 [Armatimonadetes bacterium]|nr:hypothetical protein [Armatimonadota bacterium]
MSQVLRYPCSECGAKLEFAPGTTSLKCPYCGHLEQISTEGAEPVRELDIQAFLDRAHLDATLETDQVLHCNQCAAEFTLPSTQEAARCPFCGSNVVVPGTPEKRIPPNAVMPFQIDPKTARKKYQDWVGSRFWAPNDLKKLALAHHGLQGVYIPYWTYDAETFTRYTGMRGEHYWETETYTDSDGNTQTRQVMRTAWYPAAGAVDVPFDDVLVLGSTHLPQMYAQAMTTWKLLDIQPYQPAFLSGFQAMRYDLDLATCWDTAMSMMAPVIDGAIRSDIGGDEQQIHSKDTEYSNVTFKHLLLPIWSGAYRYRGRSWRFLVNGQTGEVRGEAPVSFWKVLIAVILGLIVIGTIVYFVQKNR